jgi:acetyl esterase/lipase
MASEQMKYVVKMVNEKLTFGTTSAWNDYDALRKTTEQMAAGMPATPGVTDMVVGIGANEAIKSMYCPNQDVRNPYISPVFGNFKNFPPLKIVADRKESLADDASNLEKIAKEAGGDVQLQLWDDTFHAFATTGKGTPESAQVLEETVEFIRKHFVRN